MSGDRFGVGHRVVRRDSRGRPTRAERESAASLGH